MSVSQKIGRKRKADTELEGQPEKKRVRFNHIIRNDDLFNYSIAKGNEKEEDEEDEDDIRDRKDGFGKELKRRNEIVDIHYNLLEIKCLYPHREETCGKYGYKENQKRGGCGLPMSFNSSRSRSCYTCCSDICEECVAKWETCKSCDLKLVCSECSKYWEKCFKCDAKICDFCCGYKRDIDNDVICDFRERRCNTCKVIYCGNCKNKFGKGDDFNWRCEDCVMKK